MATSRVLCSINRHILVFRGVQIRPQELLFPFLPQDVVHIGDDLPIGTSLKRKHLSSVVVPCKNLSIRLNFEQLQESPDLDQHRLYIRPLDGTRLSMLPQPALR